MTYSPGLKDTLSGTTNVAVLSTAGNSVIGDGVKIVTTAGTREQLSASSVPCKKVYIQALYTNTDSIVVGGATIAVGRGISLLAGGTIEMTASDLNLVYIDSVVNGEGVTYTYEN